MSGHPLVIASHNAGKLREIKELIEPLGFDVSSAGDWDIEEPEENGATFEENAAIKSENTAQKTGKLALADDSGLVVPDLDGAPGIYSARWAGESKDFQVAMQRIHDELEEKNISPTGAPAYFVCVLSLSHPDHDTIHFRGEVHGTLQFPPSGDKGFGYDPIFIPQGCDKSFAEMTAEEKHAISHRARAFVLFLDFLRNQAA